MGYYKATIKDEHSSTDLDFRSLEELYDYAAKNDGPTRDDIEENTEDVHFFGDKLVSFHSAIKDTLGREWIIDYDLSDYPAREEMSYSTILGKLTRLG